jgi:type IV pilus assembly protein PilC
VKWNFGKQNKKTFDKLLENSSVDKIKKQADKQYVSGRFKIDVEEQRNDKVRFTEARVTKRKRILLDNIGLLLSSGMGVNATMRTIYKNSHDDYIKKVVAKMIDDIENGDPLWKSFQKTRFLPGFLVAFVKIGEESGNMAKEIKRSVEYMEKEARRSGQLRSALFYPAFVLTLTLSLGIGMSIFVLPRIGDVFRSMNVELPWITKIMLDFGDFMAKWGLIMVPLMIILMAILFFILFVFKPTKGGGQWLMFHLPVFHDLIVFTEVGRFSYNLGMLMEAGVPIGRAVKVMEEIQNFYMYKRLMKLFSKGIKDGKSFSNMFEENANMVSSMVPFTAQEIIMSGEESGRLSEVLKTVSEKFDYEAEMISKNMAVLMEPFLLIVVWSGVVVLAFAILVPIYSLVGNFNVGAK